MANIVFAGDAAAVAEVATVQVTGNDAATTYKLTLNGKTVSTTGAGSATLTAAALATAWNASTYPEMAEITAANNASDTVTLTHDTAGIPFAAHLSKSVTGGAGTMGSVTTATSADGPNVCSANNFKDLSSGARGLPTNSDALYFQDTDVDLLYNLEALAAVTVTALHIKQSYEGLLGLPYTNTAGATDYNEYRPKKFKLGATLCHIGEGSGDGSGRVWLDLTTVQSAVYVWASGDANDDNYYPIVIIGTHASNVLRVEGGQVDVAPFGGDAATFATVTATASGQVRCSDLCTLTTVNCDGSSSVRIESAATTASCRDSGQLTIDGTGAITTINALGGTVFDNSSGTKTTVSVANGATVSAAGNAAGCTWTNTTLTAGATVRDPNRKVTFTNAISVGNNGLEDFTLELGKGRTILPGAP